MNELKVFRNELFEVAVKLDNGDFVFDAEHVARCLGFTTVAKSGNVTVRWSRVNDYLSKNSLQVGKGDFIPEPLVYKLAFKANNEVAEQFQDWLAIEVIPSIRKTGQYIKPLSEKEQLMAAMKLSLESAEELTLVKTEVKEVRSMVENQITLDHGEQRRVQKAIGHRVYELENDQNMRSQRFRELHREIRDRFAVASYRDIKRKDLLTVIGYIEAWVPRRVS